MSVDIHTANRRHERFLMMHGYNPTESPDDRKTYDDILQYPNLQSVSREDGQHIATIIFCPDTQEIRIEYANK